MRCREDTHTHTHTLSCSAVWFRRVLFSCFFLLTHLLFSHQVVGRAKPTPTEEQPKLFRHTCFAPNYVVAKTKFWKFMREYHKVKKANGEVFGVRELKEKRPNSIKNFQVQLRWYSRQGPVNTAKEFRDTHLSRAVSRIFNDLAGQHRASFSNIQVCERHTHARANPPASHSLSHLSFPPTGDPHHDEEGLGLRAPCRQAVPQQRHQVPAAPPRAQAVEGQQGSACGPRPADVLSRRLLPMTWGDRGKGSIRTSTLLALSSAAAWLVYSFYFLHAA